MTVLNHPGQAEKWPRAHNWFIGPLHIFRNPDAGVTLDVAGFRFGPGQCGERTYDEIVNPTWCYRPYGHNGEHASSITEALAAR